MGELLVGGETARPVNRRGFILGTAGALAAAGLAGPLAEQAPAATRRHRVVPSPEPIPGGLPVGLPAPYDLIHIFLPGPTTTTLPFSGSQLQGLDVEPTTLTDFEGKTAMAYLIGMVKGSDGVERGLEVDLRVSKGEYVTADGSHRRGAFAMIWVDLFESGPGSPQIHDYNGGIPPNGLFWTVALPRGSFSVSDDGSQARLHVRRIPITDFFVFAGVNSTPAELDISVHWEATGAREERGSGASVPDTDPAAFLGRFRPARATGTFGGVELGYGFKTVGRANSDLGFAELGSERNGSFLD